MPIVSLFKMRRADMIKLMDAGFELFQMGLKGHFTISRINRDFSKTVIIRKRKKETVIKAFDEILKDPLSISV